MSALRGTAIVGREMRGAGSVSLVKSDAGVVDTSRVLSASRLSLRKARPPRHAPFYFYFLFFKDVLF